MFAHLRRNSEQFQQSEEDIFENFFAMAVATQNIHVKANAKNTIKTNRTHNAVKKEKKRNGNIR